MADVKITGLTSISTVDTANDPLPIVDVDDKSQASTGSTKKVTVNQIMAAGAAGTFASATISNDLTVDTSTLKVDSTNNRVGVNTATPATALDVVGSASISGTSSFSAGTQAAPSISTTGDTDTGVYFPAANTVGISTNATEKARIDSAGSLIVGGQTSYASFAGAAGGITCTLQAQSDAGTSSVGVVRGTSTKDSICLFSDGSNVGLGTNQTKTLGFTAAPPIKFYTGGILKAQIPGVTVVNNEGFVAYTNDAILNGIRVGKGAANVSNNLTIGGISGGGESGSLNTAVGILSLNALTTGSVNTAVGYQSLPVLTTGTNNVAVGYQSGLAITTQSQNTFVGMLCGRSGADNVGIGCVALTLATSSNNVAIGSGAADTLTTGTVTAVGKSALTDATTGLENTGVGFQALVLVSTGNRNTAVGSGSGGSVTTGSDNTAIGYNTSFGAATASGRIALGKGVTATGNNRITIGIDNNLAELDLDGIDTSWAASSDERLKKNIQNLGTGLSFVTSLRPVSFQWRSKREVPVELANLHADSDEPVHGDSAKVYHGFVAQEVKASIDAHPEVVSGQHFWESREDGVQTLAPADLVPVLVNCIKELTARVQALENP